MKKIQQVFAFFMILVCMSAAGCSKGDAEWEPDRERPWNFTPTISESGSEAYDIEVTLDSESYLSTVDEIRIYVLNKTGETFTLESTGLFIEKYDARAFVGIESTEGWVRLPYYTGVGMYKKGWTAKNDITFIFYAKYLQENCKLTPGQYRFVVFLGDGPHYAYFEITG